MRETTDKAKRHSRHKHIDTSLLVYVGENEIWIQVDKQVTWGIDGIYYFYNYYYYYDISLTMKY